MPTPNTRFNEFFEALNRPKNTLLTAKEFDVWRQSAPNWMSRAYRFTGVGAVLTGGRWNVPKVIPAVYGSTNVDTMHAEVYARAHAFGWSREDLRPQLIVAMNWKLQAVLDLTLAETLDALAVKQENLLWCDWKKDQLDGREPLTQAIARAAFECLAEGLVAPSARQPDGVNVVLFPSNLRQGSLVTTHHEEDIPFMHGLR